MTPAAIMTSRADTDFSKVDPGPPLAAAAAVEWNKNGSVCEE